MITFEQTTDFDVIGYCQAVNHPTWGYPLTLEQYQNRESLSYKNGQCDLTRDYNEVKNGGYYFVLRDSEVNNGTGNKNVDTIVSACEILVRPSWFSREGKIHECLSAVVGSVYTAPQHRHQGYAKQMLTELVGAINSIALGPYDFSYLYSDVGEFYSQFGFKSYPTPTATIPLTGDRPQIAADYVKLQSDYQHWLDVYSQKLINILEHSRYAVVLQPAQSVIDWWEDRSKITAMALDGITKEQADEIVFGAAIGDEFIIWTNDYRAHTVIVLMLYAESLDTVKTLLKLCQFHAPSSMARILFWENEVYDYNKTGQVDEAVPKYIEEIGGETNVKNTSLNALQMLHSDEPPKWVGNGKWCWF